MLSWHCVSWSKELLCACLFRRCRPIRSRSQRTFAPLVEMLESRFLPSVSLNFVEFHDPSRIAAGQHVGPRGILPQNNGFQFPVGYVPSDIQTAYGFDQVMFGSVVGDGTGQTIAIVDAYDDPAFVNSTDPNFANSDLAQFDLNLGIADPPSFMKVNQSGQTSPLPGLDPSGAGNPNGNWEIEEALDVEWAHGIAPGANIILVEANSANDPDLFAAVATAAALPGVSAVSMSWGENEASTQLARDGTFTTPSGHVGVTFLAASGDTGGFGVDQNGDPTTTPGIDYPAASPNVVAVGGTNLQLNSDSTYQGETAWTGSGGGTSLYESEPKWQQGVQQTGFRTTPDVAFDADPYTGVAIYDSYNNRDQSGPWVDIGGTSLGAPSWAGLIAIANQGRVLAGGGPLDGPSQTLPALYSFQPPDFNDITQGSNGVFNAGPGYDEVTGLGTPVAPALIADLTTYGSANHIAVTAQPPSSVIVGDHFGVVVAAMNSVGGIDPGFNGTLTIGLASGPAGATLSGPTTATAVNGVAVFDGLSLDTLGSGYTLQISSDTFPAITTNAFAVIADPTPWQGTFYPVPTDASLRAAINAADSNGFAFNTILLSASTCLLTDRSAGGLVIANNSALPSKTLTISGQGQTSTVIGATYFWHSRIFAIEGALGKSLNVAVDDLTIQRGAAEDGGVLGGGDALGGGVLINDANVTLTNVLLQKNQAQGMRGAVGAAGGIGLAGGAGGNGTKAAGGAIYLASGMLTLFNDTFKANAALGGIGGTGGAGGGQGTKAAPAVNAGPGGAGGSGGSAAGGAVYVRTGVVVVENDTFESNQALGGAGGAGGAGGSGGHGHAAPGKTGGVGGAGGPGGAAFGGGIYLAGGSLTLTAAALQNDSAVGGAGGQGGAGGPGTFAGTPTGIFGGNGSTFHFGPTGSVLVGGSGGNGGPGGTGGTASGGGVYVAAGSITLVDSTIAANLAAGGAGGTGGHGGTGGFGSGHTNFLGLGTGKMGGQGGTGGQGGAGNGGGIHVAGGTVVLYADTLSANHAQGGKGGAGGTGGYGPYAALSSGFAIGTGSGGTGGGTTGGGGTLVPVSGGPGGNGGNGGTGRGAGFYLSGGSLTLCNATVADNTVAAGAGGSAGAGGKAGTGKVTGGMGDPGFPGDSFGGGCYVNGGALNLDNSTIALNTQVGTGTGGGAFALAPGTVAAVSSLFGGNGTVNYAGNVTASQSLFQTAPTGTLSGSGNLVGVDPLLDTRGLTNNGGPTQTIALQATSPAIGAGANSLNLFADQRGNDPRSGPRGTDIGAYQTDAPADTQSPTASLSAPAVTSDNASALNPYTFTITYSDNVATLAASLANAVVQVQPPGATAPITASVASIVAGGAADGIGNAQSFVVTYAITPPGGSWTADDDGTYTVILGGGTVTDLTGNGVASGVLGTFSVQVSGGTSPVVITRLTPPGATEQVPTGTYTVATFTDSNPNPLGTLTATVAWGDGQTDALTVANGGILLNPGGGFRVVDGYTYAEEASGLTFSVQVVDGAGGSDSKSATINVADAPLTDTSSMLSASGTEAAATGSIVAATFTDANPGNHSTDFTATIHWGNGASSAGTVSYSGGTYTVSGSTTYAEEGSYTVTVDVADDGGSKLTGIGKTTVTVTDAALTDTSSTQSAGSTEGAATGSIIVATFTDANAGDNSAEMTATIHWGDGTSTAGTVSYAAGTYTVTGSTTYAEEGSYTVTADVSDTGGSKLTGIGKATVTTGDAALTDTSSPVSANGTEGSASGSIVVATFTDANPGNHSADFTVTVHWGDGSSSTGTVSYSGGTYTVSVSTTYAEEGSYTVTVDVADDGGSKQTGIGKTTVKVADAALTDTSSTLSASGTEGAATGTIKVATFNDANPGDNSAEMTATIHWANGNTSAGTITYAAGTYTVTGNTTYAEEGSYPVTVDVADTGGSKLTGVGKTTVTIADAALTDTSSTGSASGTEGSVIGSTVVATFTDANSGNNSADLTATIHWGNGNSSAGTISYSGGTYTVSGSTTYAEEGSYSVTVDVADDGGSKLTGIGKTIVTVADAALTDTSSAGSASGTEGASTGSIIAATFTDANPGNHSADFTTTIHWGDGSSSTGTVSFSGGKYTVSGSTAYVEEGSYTVTVDVTDPGGSKLTGIGKTTVTVADGTLTDTSSGNSASGTEGASTGSIAVASFTDANPGNHSADFTATIHWGDGTSSAGTVSYSGGTYTVSGSTTYAEEGSYTVTVDVADDGGSKLSGIGKTTVTVADATLTDTSSTQSAGSTEGASTGTIAVATFTDANPGNNAAEITAAIHWGDGTSSDGTVSYAGGTYTVTGSSAYAEEGSNTVTVDVTDTGGSKLTGIGKTTVTVADAALTDTSSTLSAFGTEGRSTGSIVVATFADANPGNHSAEFTATVHWSDGGTSAGTVSYSGGTYTVTDSTTFAEEGSYVATVDVVDDGSSNLTGIGKTTVTVADATLNITAFNPPTGAIAGVNTGTLNLATFTDVNTSPDIKDFTAVVSWGDGSSDTLTGTNGGIIANADGSFGVVDSHTYPQAMANVTFSVNITDAGGSNDGKSAQISVALNVVGQTFTATENSPVQDVMVATFTDTAATTYTATVTWGDNDSSAFVTVVKDPNVAHQYDVVATKSHSYAEGGTYHVVVAVQAANGTSGKGTGTAAVADLAISASSATLPTTAEAAILNATVATFKDADTTEPITSYTATIDWGDGRTSAGTIKATSTRGSFVVSGSHGYADEGKYKVTVSITDTGGGSATATDSATVADAALTPTGKTVSATEGNLFSGTIATFRDANTAAPVGDFTASIAWGDSHSSTGTVQSIGGSQFAVLGSHTYAEKGTYAVRVTITDVGGAKTTASSTARVADAPLTGAAVSIAPVHNTPFNGLVATFADANPAAPLSDFTATITWGDGSTTRGTVILDPQHGFDVLGNHTYPRAGIFTITITIADVDGFILKLSGKATVS
jgi:hypothetical protein